MMKSSGGVQTNASGRSASPADPPHYPPSQLRRSRMFFRKSDPDPYPDPDADLHPDLVKKQKCAWFRWRKKKAVVKEERLMPHGLLDIIELPASKVCSIIILSGIGTERYLGNRIPKSLSVK